MRFDLGDIDWVAISAIATAVLAGLVWWQIRLQRIELQRRERIERNQREMIRRQVRSLLHRIGGAIVEATRTRESLPPGIEPDRPKATPDLSSFAAELEGLAAFTAALTLAENRRLNVLSEALEAHARVRPPFLPTDYDDTYWTHALRPVVQTLEAASSELTEAKRREFMARVPRWQRWRRKLRR